ncbi:MAG: hypothetical protein ACK5UQ_20345, partial [Planctomycetota bacterium]
MSTPVTSSPTRGRGRPLEPNSTSGKIRALLAAGTPEVDIAKKLGCAPQLVYKVRVRLNGGKKSGRGPGRPRKSVAPAAAMDGLAGIVDMVKKSEAERARLHGA